MLHIFQRIIWTAHKAFYYPKQITHRISQSDCSKRRKNVKDNLFKSVSTLGSVLKREEMQLHKKVPLLLALMDMWSKDDLFLHTTSQMVG